MINKLPLHILNLEPENYSPQALSILSSLGEVMNGPLTRPQLMKQIGKVEILIVRLGHQIDKPVLEKAVNLRVIVSATTGLDHIDIACAEARSITVLSLRGEYKFLRGIPATAELTWALLLALVRKIPAAFHSVKEGHWDRDNYRGHDLAGKTLGIIGLGRIGEKVACYGKAFGMRVIAYDPFRPNWPLEIERTRSLEDCLRQSQVCSIHVPLNENTRGMIGVEELAYLPKGALLINTARGEILDEAALLQALVQHQLAGAALDVIKNERDDNFLKSALWKYIQDHNNLLVTPHIGGATIESMNSTEIFMANKLAAFINPDCSNARLACREK